MQRLARALFPNEQQQQQQQHACRGDPFTLARRIAAALDGPVLVQSEHRGSGGQATRSRGYLVRPDADPDCIAGIRVTTHTGVDARSGEQHE